MNLRTTGSLNRARRRGRRGFTLVELMVALGILLAAILAVSRIFSISSDVTSRTAAHAELLEAAAGVRERLAAELARLAPDSLLIIDSPRPTLARGDVPNDRRLFRMRHDRLVFVTHSANQSAYQSQTHRWAVTPATVDRSPPTSGQAIVYFGPTLAVQADGLEYSFEDDATALAASQWIYGHRNTLFFSEIPPNTDPTWTPMTTNAFEAMLSGGPLAPTLRDGRTDVLLDSDPASIEGSYVERFSEFIRNKTFADILSAAPSIRALWEPHLAPTTFSLADTADRDFYTRLGSILRHGMADVRIEWTDGRRVNPNDPNPANRNFNTRWFGLFPDGTQNVDLTQPDNLTFYASRRQNALGDTTPSENQTFADQIEWAPFANAAHVDAAYRAIWRADTWSFRPKAIRVTMRLYDGTNRLKDTSTIDLDEDGDPDPDGNILPPYVVTRYGIEHSFVLPVP
ncbi:MAG: hypothetical protein HBSAPP02_18030 [Phycisphaerae bacterium]|nr:MAG: prepilin-type N-terminal cleavage/methylation domain-containing protein [Planctomycetia bacterium]GJQ26771.1 MAG: hypothetical protein HBSAPP02_18030 [Phycisphaerae bacterium]